MKNKNLMIHLVAVGVLCVGFLLCRYVFFEVHGMYDMPLTLFIFGLLVEGVSFLVKAKMVPIITAVAYIIGFVIGAVFQTNRFDAGGGRVNNLWMIWLVVFVCLVIISIVVELVSRKKSKIGGLR